MTEAERLAASLQERYEFRVALNAAIMDPFEAPTDQRDEELRGAAAELRRLQAEVEAMRVRLERLLRITLKYGLTGDAIRYEFAQGSDDAAATDTEVEALRKDAERYRWAVQLTDAQIDEIWDAQIDEIWDAQIDEIWDAHQDAPQSSFRYRVTRAILAARPEGEKG